jgi:glycine/D-amino acid oxidase-like deaminating enzyme
VTRWFDASRIESVFEVEEGAFDAARLAHRMASDLHAAGVQLAFETDAERVETVAGGALVSLRSHGEARTVSADLVLNCTYSRLNHLLADSNAAPIPAKHELTELALVEPPPEMHGAAVTVMDGPFFSMMPYPSRGRLFTLSHVRYTPHCQWHDTAGDAIADGDAVRATARSRFEHMIHDAQRYLPAMRNTRYVDSLYEIKTVLPRSEQDDSRPILLRRSERHPALLTVLGAKIDSVYDVEEALAAELALTTVAC